MLAKLTFGGSGIIVKGSLSIILNMAATRNRIGMRNLFIPHANGYETDVVQSPGYDSDVPGTVCFERHTSRFKNTQTEYPWEKCGWRRNRGEWWGLGVRCLIVMCV